MQLLISSFLRKILTVPFFYSIIWTLSQNCNLVIVRYGSQIGKLICHCTIYTLHLLSHITPGNNIDRALVIHIFSTMLYIWMHELLMH